MRSYGQYCPVAHGAEIFADRWTPLIVRELDLGAHRYNEIRHGLPGISRTLLANRLRQLERDRVVERSDGDYRLTEAGRALVQVVDALGRWGARHSFGQPRPDELDAALPAFYEVWLGRRSFAAAVAACEVRLEGRPQVVRAFPTWLRFSHFADDVRAATAAAAG